MKSVYKIDDVSYRTDLLIWIRGDFKLNKELKDEVQKLINCCFDSFSFVFCLIIIYLKASIKIAVIRAKKGLNELETSMNMAK